MNKTILVAGVITLTGAVLGAAGLYAMDNFHMHNSQMKSSSFSCGGNMKDCKDGYDTSAQRSCPS